MHCRHVGRQADESHSSQWIWRSVSAQTLLRRRCSGTWTQTGKTHRWSDPAAVTLSGVTGHHCRANGAKVLWLLLLCRFFCYRGFKRSLTFTKPLRDLILTLNQTLASIKWKCATLHPKIVKIDRTLGTISIVWVFLLHLCLFFALQRSSRHVFYIPRESYTVVLQDNSFEHWPLMLRRK